MGTTATLMGDLWHLPDGNKSSNKNMLGEKKNILCLLMQQYVSTDVQLVHEVGWYSQEQNPSNFGLFCSGLGNYAQILPALVNCRYSLLYLVDKTVYPLAPARQRLKTKTHTSQSWRLDVNNEACTDFTTYDSGSNC